MHRPLSVRRHSHMNPVNKEALSNARQMMNRHFGEDISDLPQEIRNTLANIYYEFSCLVIRFEGGQHPETMLKAHGFMRGLKKFAEENAFLRSAVDALPTIISEMRSLVSAGNRKGYDLSVRLFLDTFKLRIPDMDKKSVLRVAIERPFYSSRVREIPDLWRLIYEPAKPHTMLNRVQEAGGKIIVAGYRRIGAEHGCAPTAKTTDQKIIEIYSKVGTAFHQAEQQRGERIPAVYLNTIVLKFLQVYEMLGDAGLEHHLQYEVQKYLAEGLRDDYKRELRFF
jgi:hypothetical protein